MRDPGWTDPGPGRRALAGQVRPLGSAAAACAQLGAAVATHQVDGVGRSLVPTRLSSSTWGENPWELLTRSCSGSFSGNLGLF